MGTGEEIGGARQMTCAVILEPSRVRSGPALPASNHSRAGDSPQRQQLRHPSRRERPSPTDRLGEEPSTRTRRSIARCILSPLDPCSYQAQQRKGTFHYQKKNRPQAGDEQATLNIPFRNLSLLVDQFFISPRRASLLV